MKSKLWIVLTLTLLLLVTTRSVFAGAPLGTAFTYQGQLKNGTTGFTGTCDMQFSLYDAASGGAQIGSTLTLSPVNVAGGLFTVQLDFGTASQTDR